MSLRYGLDFGTTNSSIAIHSNGDVRLLPLDAQAANPAVMPTLLYISRDRKSSVGRAAIEKYVTHNVGREFNKQKVRIGTSSDGEPMWSYIDVDVPGRFFQSLKSFLSDRYFPGTEVFGTHITIEELVAIILRSMKRRADRTVGQEVRAVTLGRPVHFSVDPAGDVIAEERLRSAAHRAGFDEVDFQYEPFAAALSYADQLQEPEKVLVFDFGGGTLDYSLLHIEPRSDHTTFSRENVLATGGIPIGGDTFNQEIMAHRLVRYFGADVTYRVGPRDTQLEVPRYIIEELRTWYTLPQLNDRRIMEFLRKVQGTANHSEPIEALIALITRNHGWGLFQAIERAKRELSENRLATIAFHEESISIKESLSRSGFESTIRSHLTQVAASILDLLGSAGLTQADVDVVITTGGTSQVPSVQKILVELFGPEKVRPIDTFTSVVAGLAIAAARTQAAL